MRDRQRWTVRALAWASAGTLVATALVLGNVSDEKSIPLALIAAGRTGPAWSLIRADFPDAESAAAEGMGHDGQISYAIARNPMDPTASAQVLDRPRYRWQRPLLSWLAAALRPGARGPGLAWAIFAVGVVAILGGGIACAALSRSLGGTLEVAAVFPLLGGCYASLRIGTGDVLATALALGATALFLERRRWQATAVAVFAVLAKEASILILVGVLLWKRSRESLVFAAIPSAIAAAWWLWLRQSLGGPIGHIEFESIPLRGLVQSMGAWSVGQQPLSAYWVVVALFLSALALRRSGLAHPCSLAIVLQLALLAMLSPHVLALDFNGPRATLPLAALSLVVLSTPPSGTRAASSERDRGSAN